MPHLTPQSAHTAAWHLLQTRRLHCAHSLLWQLAQSRPQSEQAAWPAEQGQAPFFPQFAQEAEATPAPERTSISRTEGTGPAAPSSRERGMSSTVSRGRRLSFSLVHLAASPFLGLFRLYAWKVISRPMKTIVSSSLRPATLTSSVQMAMASIFG